MEFDLGSYFYETFGYRSEAFEPKFDDTMIGDVAKLRTPSGAYGSPYYAVDNILGREYYLPVQIDVGNSVIPSNTSTAAQLLGLGGTSAWYLPFPVVSGNIVIQKHIIDTQLTERNGLVSELININAFKVNLKGFIIGANNEFPEKDFATLNRLFNLNIPVTINNPVTDILLMQYAGSKTVTLRNLKFMQKKGVKHVVPYELDMVSEMPFDLNQIY